MSGGHFNYEQYKIAYIADEVEHLILKYSSDDYDWKLSPETLSEFKKGLEFLRLAEIYTQRIDWLVSGDDGEDNFHLRLKSDLAKINNEATE